MSTLAHQLAAVLGSVRTPGDFCTAGAIDLALPRLTVQGVGPVALPLLPVQAAQLVAVADRAPYGRGAETLVDTTVRRTWQIGADRVRTEGEHWARTLQAIVARAAEGLGVTTPVAAQLYKLLVYDEGSFFVGHRDTEKAAGMFASLVVALPSIHTGGELVVRHKGREVRLDLAAPDPSMAAYAAFYADCVHEVLPVTSGCRLTLVYNLLRQGAGRLPEPPDHEAETARLAALLADWAAGRPAAGGDDDDDDEAAGKLVYPLEHAYTPAELSFQALKGPDAAAAAVLAAAAQRSGCELHVALLTLVESGSAEHTGYARRRSWRDDDAADDEFEIVEVYDRSATLSDWRCVDGSAADFGVFPFDETELSPPEALQGMKPDEQSFEEATGNEGASFERSYRRAALVLWPRSRRLAVVGAAGLPVSLPRLAGLARRWRESGAGVDSALWQEAHELAGHMLASWPQPDRWARRSDAPGNAAGMLDALTQLEDAERIEAFLADVCAAGVHGKGDNESLLAAAALLDPQRAAALIERIVQANAAGDPGACADLLARAAAAAPAGGSGGARSLVAAARALVESLPGGTAPALQQPTTAAAAGGRTAAACAGRSRFRRRSRDGARPHRRSAGRAGRRPAAGPACDLRAGCRRPAGGPAPERAGGDTRRARRAAAARRVRAAPALAHGRAAGAAGRLDAGRRARLPVRPLHRTRRLPGPPRPEGVDAQGRRKHARPCGGDGAALPLRPRPRHRTARPPLQPRVHQEPGRLPAAGEAAP